MLTARVIMVTVMRVVCCLLHVINQERMAHTAIPLYSCKPPLTF